MKKSLKNMIIESGLEVAGNQVKINGVLYPLPLVKGNSKIGGNVYHASTLPSNQVITAVLKDGSTISEKGTCPLTCEGCYGLRGNYKFNTTKKWLILRTRLLIKYPEIYFMLVKFQIIAEKIQYLRVHATGDFVHGEAIGWAGIFSQFPRLIGWTYTKCLHDNDIETLDSLSNFNIVDSIVKGCGFNFGHIDYILATYETLKAQGKNPYICRCGIDKNQHCGNCTACSNHKNVLFIEHSTGYNASADPLYNKAVEIIDSQPSQVR